MGRYEPSGEGRADWYSTPDAACALALRLVPRYEVPEVTLIADLLGRACLTFGYSVPVCGSFSASQFGM